MSIAAETLSPADLSPSRARRAEYRYYTAMLAPFVLDIAITIIFVAVSGRPDLLLRNLVTSVPLLLVGLHIGARIRFRPVRRFLETGQDFAAIERTLTQLPIRSAFLSAYLFLPIMLYRLVLPLVAPPWVHDLVFGMQPMLHPTWTDAVLTTVIETLFIFVVVYFLVSEYLEGLCLFMFRRYGVNLNLFFGKFRRKIVIALAFVSGGPVLLILGELVSYRGDRLVNEILIDLVASVFGLGVALFWVMRALTRPLARLSTGIERLSAGDLTVRLPVTSNEEVGELTARFNTMVEGLRERQRIRETFGKYVSESVASALMRQTGDGRLRGRTAEATLLFTDIEGFTTLSEHLDPEVLIAVLNEYLEVVVEPIQRHGGVVSSFIGDGLFASFNLPLPNEAHAASAVAAAVDIQRALASRVFTGGVKLATRIGLNTGTVIGGTIGAGDRLSYTLLGDAVNTASRLQELNKVHGTAILATEATCHAAGPGFTFRPIGDVPIRGREESLSIFCVEFE